MNSTGIVEMIAGVDTSDYYLPDVTCSLYVSGDAGLMASFAPKVTPYSSHR